MSESAATPREVLIEARLVSHTFVADDGYLSSAIHTSEEAADLALAALAKAGWKVVKGD